MQLTHTVMKTEATWKVKTSEEYQDLQAFLRIIPKAEHSVDGRIQMLKREQKKPSPIKKPVEMQAGKQNQKQKQKQKATSKASTGDSTPTDKAEGPQPQPQQQQQPPKQFKSVKEFGDAQLDCFLRFGIDEYEYTAGWDPGLANTNTAVVIRNAAVLDLRNQHGVELHNSLVVRQGSLAHPRQVYGEKLKKLKEEHPFVGNIESELAQAVKSPPVAQENGLKGLLGVVQQLGTFACDRRREYGFFTNLPKVQKLKHTFKNIHSSNMSQAVETFIRMPGRQYNETELRVRKNRGQRYYARALPDKGVIYLIGDGTFDATHKGRMTSCHTEFLKLAYCRINELNKVRARLGQPPHLIFRVNEAYTTKNCPRCQKPFDFFYDPSGQRMIRAKRCYRYVLVKTCVFIECFI
jgi:hypothetical protein